MSRATRDTNSSRETSISIRTFPLRRMADGKIRVSRPAPTKIPVPVTINHSSQSRFSSAASCWLSLAIRLIFPSAIMRRGNVRMEIEVSRELFVSLVALLILFNTYIISRRLELRRTRDAVISATIQSELARLQSFTDPLTEVYNRRSLDDMAGKYMGRAKRLGTPLTFMVLDVDGFKEINTRFGHLTGDFVLAEIAAILTSAVRGSDAVVRYGGDEFLIILGEADLRGGQIVAGRIAKYSEDWSAAGHLPKFELTISIGLR